MIYFKLYVCLAALKAYLIFAVIGCNANTFNCSIEYCHTTLLLAENLVWQYFGEIENYKVAIVKHNTYISVS